MTSMHTTHLYLQTACDDAEGAHNGADNLRDIYIASLRHNLIAALARCDMDSDEEAEALLEDTIQNALLDGMDVDWNIKKGARDVMEALFDFGESK